MAVEDLDVLRDSLPDVFRHVTLPAEWDDPFIFVPVDEPVGVVPGDLVEWIDDLPLVDDPLSPLELPPGLRGEFPGAPTRLPVDLPFQGRGPAVGRTGLPLPPAIPPDCLAFYLPFHYFYPHWWGVYLTLEGVSAVAWFIASFDPGLTFRDSFLAAQAFLYGHEHYHHKVECFATKLEVTHREPLYRTTFESVYRRHVGSPQSSEEVLATAAGFRKALEPFRADRLKRAAVAAALERYVSLLPSGYREAWGHLPEASSRKLEVEFAEQNQREAFPQKGGKPGALWLVFPNAFQGISRRTSRVNYIVRRNSPIAQRSGLSPRYLRYKELTKRLEELAGCQFERTGKGGHEVWRAANRNQVIIPRHPGELATGTVRNIIKQAGLPYSIEQFMNATGR